MVRSPVGKKAAAAADADALRKRLADAPKEALVDCLVALSSGDGVSRLKHLSAGATFDEIVTLP